MKSKLEYSKTGSLGHGAAITTQGRPPHLEQTKLNRHRHRKEKPQLPSPHTLTSLCQLQVASSIKIFVIISKKGKVIFQGDPFFPITNGKEKYFFDYLVNEA